MKKVTFVSFIIFIGVFVALAFFSPAQNKNTTTTKTTSQTVKKVTTVTTPKPTTTPTTTVTTKPALTAGEVAKHNSQKSCYLIINDAVYDVTSYINQHPGGVRNITKMCGQDATQAFTDIHSNFAWSLLKNFYIGDLEK